MIFAEAPGLVHLLKTVVSVPVLGFLPGYLLLQRFAGETPGGSRLRTLDRVLVATALSLALSSVMALLLAQARLFDVDLLTSILAVVGLAAWLTAPRAVREAAPGVADERLSALLLVAVLVVAAALFSPPFQTALWAGDSTLYVGYGVQIGRSGSYVFEDPLLVDMPIARREELFRNRAEEDMTGSYARFPGGIGFVDIASGEVAAGFSPLFPVCIAIFAQLFGSAQVFWVSSLFGACSVAMVFCIGRALHSTQAGVFAAAWLLASMPQIWFSRLPMSDVGSQFFLLAGLWMALLYLRTEGAFLGGAAGFVLGAAGLTGFDVMVTTNAGVLTVAAALLASGRRLRCALAFVACYTAMVLYGVAHLVHYPSNYAAFFSQRLPRLPFGATIVSTLDLASAEFWFLLSAAVASALCAVVWLLGARLVAEAKTRRRLAALGLGSVVGAYLTGYVIASLPRYGDTLRWFPLYFSWPIVVLFLVSLAGIVVRQIVKARDPEVIALLAGGAVVACPVLYNPQLQDFGVHIGTIRRFVPFVFPAMLLVAAVGLAWAIGRTPITIRRLAGPIAAALLLALVARPSATIIGQRYWRDGVVESTALAAMFPPGAVILVSPQLAGTHAQAALTFWHGLMSLAMISRDDAARVLEGQIVDWLRGGREVFLLDASAELHLPGAALTLEEYGARDLTLETLADAPTLPVVTETRSVRMTAYRFGFDPTPKSFVDVGSYSSDALFLLDGFHGPETDAAGASYRWTGARASIQVPRSRRLLLELQGARPPGVPPAVVSIWADDQPVLQDVMISDEPTRLALYLAEVDSADPVTIRLASNTFNPRRLGLSDDGRELGVRLYRADFGR